MDKLSKNIVVTASILAAITIAIGAFGAHGLKQLVSAESLVTFETGVRYQMYHALALFVIGFASAIPPNTKKWVFRFFCIGMLFFSGSIYLLALKELLPFSISFLGPITPVGGLLFIIGWGLLARGLLTINRG
ncbi:DUF423 domain-containing protein [Rasiella sp. SM2506]|uniref:DUF423 domain-containing protein n=1 Tax=Rasiella sp. SM2506 TaxID=3423914 RepID=UPI003D7B2CB2